MIYIVLMSFERHVVYLPESSLFTCAHARVQLVYMCTCQNPACLHVHMPESSMFTCALARVQLVYMTVYLPQSSMFTCVLARVPHFCICTGVHVRTILKIIKADELFCSGYC